MGRVRKILESELVGGTQNTDVYPITSTEAVYTRRNMPLGGVLDRNLPINVSTEYNDSHTPEVLTLIQAVSKIPTSSRVLGLNCRFLSTEGWKNYVYTGSTIENADWNSNSNWLEYVNSTQLINVEDNVESLKKSTNAVIDITDEKNLSVDVLLNNKYIDIDGDIIENNSYIISSPIEVNKGDIIQFNARVSNVVSVISKVQENSYIPLLLGADVSSVKSYRYVMNEDCSIVLSVIKSNWDKKVYIVKSSAIDSQLSIENQIEIQKNEIEKLNDTISTLGYSKSIKKVDVDILGKYIEYYTGNYVEYSNYLISAPIKIKKGQYIEVSVKAANIVSVISSKNSDGSYTTLISGRDVQKEQVYRYLTDKDLDIVVCYYSNKQEEKEVTILTYMPTEEMMSKYLSSFKNVEYTGLLQQTSPVYTIKSLKKGDYVIAVLSSNNTDNTLRITLNDGDDKKYFGKSLVYVIYTAKENLENVKISFYSKNNSNVNYCMWTNYQSDFHVPSSIYKDRLKNLDNVLEPTINLPYNIQYKNIIVDTQILYNNLTETVKTEISKGNTNLNIIFKDNIFRFNDQNLISLSKILDSSVNLRFCCDNAKIISDGKQYIRNNRIALSGSRNVFDTDSIFNYKNSIIVNEEYIYPDINRGKGVLYFIDHVIAVDSNSYIYKAPVSQDIDTSNIIGKKICFTAWWLGIFADITDAKEEEGKKYIYFKVSAKDSSYIDSDLTNYGVYPIVKILNLEDKSAINSYYVDEGKIYLPNADIVYQCEYPQFIDISNSTFGSVIFCNMYFIGSANLEKPLINASGTSNVFILNSTFKNIGHSCIFNVTSNGNNGNILVKGCTFYKCQRPVYLNGNNSSVRNNIFEKSGYYWQPGQAIVMQLGKNFYIGHNIIKDFTYSAIYISGGTFDQTGNTGIIEYNTIETIDWDSDYIEHQLIDSGAIQISIVNSPVIVRHNFINNYKTRKSGRGIMMGGNCSQISIYKNLITNITSYSAIDFYKGSEKNQYYPNGVEDLIMYNIIEGSIRMLGGDDFTDYSSYTKVNNDCVCAYNLIGNIGYNMSDQAPANVVIDIPYFEMPIIDRSLSYRDKNHILLSYNVSSWDLSDFIMGKLQLSMK